MAFAVGLTTLPPPEEAFARETRKDDSAVSIVPLQGFWGGLWLGVKDMRSTVAEASEEHVGGRTPVPDCHGDAERMPSGGEVSMEFHNGVLAWACVDSDGEYVTVKLTNTFTAPLTVASDPAATLQHPGIGISDALLVEIGKSWGHDVLPVKGRGELKFPVESLPATIELSSDHEVVLSGILPTALDLSAEIGGANDIQRILNSKEGIECIASVLEGDYIGVIPCGLLIGEIAGKKAAAAVLGLVLATIDFGPTVIGQFIQDWRGSSSIALNYESGDRRESGIERFVGEWSISGGRGGMEITPDSTGTLYSDAWYCADESYEPGADDFGASRCTRMVSFDLSEVSSRGATAAITAVDYETWDGGTPTDVDTSDDPQSGDTFRLDFTEGGALHTTWLNRPEDYSYGIHDIHWCNPEISDMSIPECGG